MASALTSDVTPAALVTQAHGGALRRGNPGNKGGFSLKKKARANLARLVAKEGVAYARQVLLDATQGKRPHAEALDCLHWGAKYGVGEPPQLAQGQAQQTQVNIGMRVKEADEPVSPHEIQV